MSDTINSHIDKQNNNTDILLQADTLITCHINADFDSFAAMIAASYLYPHSIMIFPDTSERTLRNYYKNISKEQYNFADIKDVNLDNIIRLIIVDTKQYARLPHISELLHKKDLHIIIWDHHPSSNDDITANILHSEAMGAVTTLVIRTLRENNISISKQDATILGLGIYSDTGSFTYSSTKPEDFKATAWLLAQGMDILNIADLVENDLTIIHVKALNGLLESAQTIYINQVPVMMASVTLDSYLGDFSNLTQKLMEMESCDVLFTLALMQAKVIVVARSRNNLVDLGQICNFLGGGGHAYAASATVSNKTIHEVKDIIYQQLYEQLNSDKCAIHYMTAPAIGIEQDKSIKDANDLMLNFDLKVIVIFQKGTKICIGTLDRQIANRAVSHNLCSLLVSEYMQRNVQSVQANASLQELTHIIIDDKQKLVPVLQENAVIGVVTRTDLINILIEEQQQIPSLAKQESKNRNLSKLMQTRLPKDIFQLLKIAGEIADKDSIPVYVVGGFVRDLLIDYSNQDIDLVVEGDGIAYAHILARELNGRVKEHAKFLTAVVIFEDENKKEKRIDIATARLEYYEYPAALPIVELSSIKMDLYRRDFSINTLAIHLNKNKFGNVVDFFGGSKDINDKRIRILHALSFVEDPTRCLRAIRFEQRYNFKLGQGTKKLIKNALHLNIIDKLSKSRLLNELKLIFDEVDPVACLCSLDSTGILKAIHQNLSLSPSKVIILQRLKEVLDWYKLLYFQEKANHCDIYLLGLCSNLKYQEAKDIFNKLLVQSNQSKKIMQLREQVHLIQPKIDKWQNEKAATSQLCNLLYNMSLTGLLYLMGHTDSIDVQKSISRYITKWKFEKIDITGADLIAMGLKSGPIVGKIMHILLAAKLDGIVTTQESQRIFALTLANQLGQAEY